MRTRPASAGFTLIEMLGVIALLGITVAIGAIYVSSMETPLQTGGELLEGTLIQSRARSVSTTTAHRVRPDTSSSLTVEIADSCGATTWTVQPDMEIDLPRDVTVSPTSWSICYSRRGIASDNVVIVLSHPERGTRTLEVLRGGVMRWL